MNGIELGIALAGPVLMVIYIWSRIDEWWYRKGKTRWRRFVMGCMKPHIQPRTIGVWAMWYSPTYYCQTRYKDWLREGTGPTVLDAYAKWKERPDIISSGGIDWETYSSWRSEGLQHGR